VVRGVTGCAREVMPTRCSALLPGDTFLAANLLPNIVFQLLPGYLVVTLLVTTLVEAINRDGAEAAEGDPRLTWSSTPGLRRRRDAGDASWSAHPRPGHLDRTRQLGREGPAELTARRKRAAPAPRR
jgi:hypothetical protein